MENRIDQLTGEACSKDGRVYDDMRRTRKKRNAARSSRSESSSNDYDHKRRRKNKRRRHDNKLDKVLAKICDLENKLNKPMVSCGSMGPEVYYSSCEVDPDITGDMHHIHTQTYSNETSMQPRGITGPPSMAVASESGEPQFDFIVRTKVKEPFVPQTSSAYLEQLKVLQHFEQTDWSSVRYLEAQKQYVHAPGFTSLKPNAEISNYDNSYFRAHMEKAFSGLTFALLKQSETIRNDMREFLNWIQQEDQLSYTKIIEKINDIFTNGEYPKITNDLFQITCGHRAELIKYRRDAILASVKDSVQKEALKKIPPSCAALFEEEKFTAVLDKAGGVRNTFWPKNKGYMTSAPQNHPSPSANQRKQFQQNRNEAENNRQPKPGSSRGSHSSRGGRQHKRHREQYQGRKTGFPSSHQEKSSQYKRKY